MDGQLGQELAGLEVLADPTRRRLYTYVAGKQEAVGRDETAEQLGLPRHVVKFHLDRLVDGGLLVTEYRRLTGRTGPGAGRPSKLYRRAPGEISVSVPPRRYALLAEVLAQAVERTQIGEEQLPAAVEAAARSAGAHLADDGPSGDVVDRLASLGYEPRADAVRVELANCPFHQLAAAHRALVCGMNLALVEGLLLALPSTGSTARLEPAAGRCCVVVDLPAGRSS